MSVPGRKWSGPEAKAGAISKENLLGVWLLSQASQMLQGAWDRTVWKTQRSRKAIQSPRALRAGKGERTQLIRDEMLPLNRVSALVAGAAAVAQVKLDLPRNGLLAVLNLEKVPISYRPLFLQ